MAMLVQAAMPSPALAQMMSAEEVRSVASIFWRAFLGRETTDAELDELTSDFLASFGSERCEYACAKQLAINAVDAALFKAQPGQPEDLRVRDGYLIANFDDPNELGRLRHRLLVEPDPIRVFDAQSHNLMTERDVVAVANLQIFAQSDKAPTHHALSAEAIDKLVADLDRQFGSQPGATAMPWFPVYASAFWAGVKRDWPDMSVEKRELARDYAKNPGKTPMPVADYQRLFGVSADEAEKLRSFDVRDSSALNTDVSRYLDLMGKATVNQVIINGMQSAVQ